MNHQRTNTKQQHIIQANYIGQTFQQQHSQEEQYDNSTKKFEQKLDQMKKQINYMAKDPQIFKNHQLPLARIKKIMKSDEDVRMISSQTPVLFAKACEIFIVQLTHRAWKFTQQSKRRTLQKSDIAACIQNTQIFDFLIDIIPKEDLKQTKKPEITGMSGGMMGSMNQLNYQFGNKNMK